MELIKKETIKVLSNPGVESVAYISPENSASEKVTISKIRVAPGIRNELHQHPTSEQVWIVLSGRGDLLLKGEKSMPVEAGDVVRFEAGEEHGLWNPNPEPFEYLSVTTPPIDFRPVYQSGKGHGTH